MPNFSQDELNTFIEQTLKSWIHEEMQENEPSSVLFEERVGQTIDSFIEQLQEFLPYRDYATPDPKIYPDYNFVTVNVHVLNEQLEDLDDEKSDYPIIMKLSDEEKNEILDFACHKDKSIFSCDYCSIDLQALEELAKDLGY